MTEKVAFIGLTNEIGQGILHNLVTKGGWPHLHTPVVIYDNDPSAAQALHSSLPDSKTVVADSVANATEDAAIIFTRTEDGEALVSTFRATFAGYGDLRGRLWVDFTPLTDDASREFGKMCSERGCEYIDCAVFGDAANAAAGSLLLVAAGPADIRAWPSKPSPDGTRRRLSVLSPDDARARLSMLSPFFSQQLFTFRFLDAPYASSSLRQLAAWDSIASMDALGAVLDVFCRFADGASNDLYEYEGLAKDLVALVHRLGPDPPVQAVHVEIEEALSNWVGTVAR